MANEQVKELTPHEQLVDYAERLSVYFKLEEIGTLVEKVETKEFRHSMAYKAFKASLKRK